MEEISRLAEELLASSSLFFMDSRYVFTTNQAKPEKRQPPHCFLRATYVTFQCWERKYSKHIKKFPLGHGISFSELQN